MTHAIREAQAKLIDLGYLAATTDGKSNIDGDFGQRTLDAYNHYRASIGKPPVAPYTFNILDVNADLWPDETPPLVQTTSNPFDNPLVKIGLEFLLPQLLKGLPMGNLFNALSGAKTYILGVVFVLIGGAAYGGWIVPGTGSFTPGAWVAVGLTLIAGRNALATSVISILEKLEGIDTTKLPPAP